MIRISTSQIVDSSINSMLDQQARVYDTQVKLSTGRRFTSPSEDPAAAARVLGLSERISMTEQYQENIRAARNRLELEDTVLGNIGNALQRARELTVQGLNDSLGASDRQAIAAEIRQILSEVQEQANSKDANDEYLFAGNRIQTKPFTDDGAGTFSYQGDQGQRLVQVGPSTRVAVGDPGLDVFMKVSDAAGTANQSVFETLYLLAEELDANAPSGDRLTELDNALERINETRAKVGARLQSLDREEDTNASALTRLQATRSQIEDLDIAQAATDLNRQMVVLQAAQQAYVKINSLSLFNFL
ncbi:MAG TPA: flagellar hook-associated protein 3 [Thiotrichales bacterium]|nr:flagellar hook-associated protein 3 [Thiotrichales bacterium]